MQCLRISEIKVVRYRCILRVKRKVDQTDRHVFISKMILFHAYKLEKLFFLGCFKVIQRLFVRSFLEFRLRNTMLDEHTKIFTDPYLNRN